MERVLAAYPRLEPDDIREALAFYEQHKAEIDQEIRENVDEG